jgi:hypothetical protein
MRRNGTGRFPLGALHSANTPSPARGPHDRNRHADPTSADFRYGDVPMIRRTGLGACGEAAALEQLSRVCIATADALRAHGGQRCFRGFHDARRGWFVSGSKEVRASRSPGESPAGASSRSNASGLPGTIVCLASLESPLETTPPCRKRARTRALGTGRLCPVLSSARRSEQNFVGKAAAGALRGKCPVRRSPDDARLRLRT